MEKKRRNPNCITPKEGGGGGVRAPNHWGDESHKNVERGGGVESLGPSNRHIFIMGTKAVTRKQQTRPGEKRFFEEEKVHEKEGSQYTRR